MRFRVDNTSHALALGDARGKSIQTINVTVPLAGNAIQASQPGDIIVKSATLLMAIPARPRLPN